MVGLYRLIGLGNPDMKCDWCKKRAKYLRRISIIMNLGLYGSEFKKTSTDYACEKHAQARINESICGPHKWRKIRIIK